MTGPERVQEVKRAAQARLLVLPGVHGVGIGPKLVDGRPTGELAIKIYVIRKKPLTELTTEEIIPPEIDGVKTDIVEMDVPTLHGDDSKERPLILGTQTMAKNGRLTGTLGFLAHTVEPQPKLVAITCQHVVAPPMGAKRSKLEVSAPDPNLPSPNPYLISFKGSNTPGTLIVVNMVRVLQNRTINVFQITAETETLSSIAKSVETAINGIADAGVTAAIGDLPEKVVITRNPAADTLVKSCELYDPPSPDPESKLLASVTGNVVTLSGKTDGEYGIYTSWSTNGSEPSHGSFTPVVKNSALTTAASDIASTINGLSISGATATATGATVTIPGATAVLCQIASDIRVGQPMDGFSSNCSLCCSDEIGRVLNAHADLDVALVQLRRGLAYMDEVKGDDSIPKPHTAITGFHRVTVAEVNASYEVHKRGATTLYTSGIVDSVDFFSGVIGNSGHTESGDSWRVFYRYYDEAMVVKGNGGLAFSAPGDSGAAVFNNSGEVVGMLFGGAADRTFVTPVDQIITGMGVTVVTATALGQKLTVSNAEGALAMVRADGDLATPQLLEVQAEISATPAGRELAELARRHAEEVQILVNTNPRVATAWHRNGGPRIAEAVFGFLQAKDTRLPEELDGISLPDCLRNIQRALMKYGSEALSADLERYGPQILALSNLSYPEMLARMRGQQSVVPVP
ncbi:hypothetical protein [Paraburkholderia sp. MM5477-R1]|uniref:hypothetical protein n=1 Tax=Paraburkholderia sp. MM5477-R1 TaxID=2991062 RepID=UPI003D1E1F2E